MSWNKGRGRSGKRWTGPAKKQKSLLQKNKKFTLIILLGCLVGAGITHAYMWGVWNTECKASCADPKLGCTVSFGYLSVAFGTSCHGYYDQRLNETVQEPELIKG